MAENEGTEGNEGTGGDEEEQTGSESENEGKGEGEDVEAQLAKMRKALKRANAEAAKYRTQAKTATPPKDDDIEARIQAARDEERELADTAWGQHVIKVEAKGALAAAGAKNAKRALGLLDLDDVDFDEDGEVIGLDAAIRALRKEMPELFNGRSASNDHKSGGEGPAKDEKKLTATERQARQLQGQL